jgi:hypothetical protein
MMLKSSPAQQQRAKEAVKRMLEGKYNKSPTLEETEARMASRRKKQQEDQIKKDAPIIADLERQHGEMKSRYEKLGGAGYQLADREQNMSAGEREARGMEGGMRSLSNRIDTVRKAGYKQGGKINLKDCVVNTAEHKNPKHNKF